MMENRKGHKDLYDIRSYNLQRNTSADVVRWTLKDLRNKSVSNFLVICSPSATNVILSQVRYCLTNERPADYSVLTKRMTSPFVKFSLFVLFLFY